MVPSLLFDISHLDMDKVMFGVADIEAINPHRGCMRLLDGFIYATEPDETPARAVAFKDVRDDEFWVPGHIPGRPLFPGVLMIEAAAQVASFVCLRRFRDRFLGFTGADSIKFRGHVVPGDRLVLLAQEVQFKRRRSICNAQGLVNGTLVFEGTITGMVM